MHPSSEVAMQQFINDYLDRSKPLKIIEVGSADPTTNNTLNATYRKMFVNDGWEFYGLDLHPGNGVDIVSSDPYHYPIEDGTYDVVVSGQTAEHVEDIFAWIKECSRILKKDGLMCIIAPWKWGYHPHPLDCWRFMRDGMRYLLSAKAGLQVLNVYEKDDDCIGIGKKTEEVIQQKSEVWNPGEDLNVSVKEGIGQRDKF